MEAIAGIISVLAIGVMVLVGIGSFVCFVLVVIQMFQHDQTGLGIATIVLALCTGLGGLLAFIYGWTKATEWRFKNVMMAWTACIGVQLVMLCLFFGAATILGKNANTAFGTVGSSIGATVSGPR